MFFKAGALGSYDPQIIKPPADYRGADSVVMAEEQKPTEEKAADVEVALTELRTPETVEC